ncbi:MAG: TenA family transcriptional regulator [Actinomycetota bacterium]|nr:TenA family transcriptional regulator [Actinomycetota bacterium]
MKAVDLLERNPAAWTEATWHPFLEAVREGSFPAGAFEAWLAQDYLFVGDALVFQARLLARAPRPAQAVLVGGLVAIEAELGWFEEQAERLGLSLDTSRHPTTAAYRDLLAGFEREPYPAAITALWAIERAYLEAWRGAAPGHPEYRQFVEHWATSEFADYVTSLEKATDDALRNSDEQEQERAETAFLEVARLERDFWEMAWSEGTR